MVRIGDVDIGEGLVLAPMAGVNCQAFRRLCRRYGASYVYSQMIGAEDCVQDPEGTLRRVIDARDDERPLCVQLIGSDAGALERAAGIVSEVADVIDVNLGCIESHWLGNKAGAFLLKHPDQIPKVVEAVMRGAKRPVTAKIRSGWDPHSLNAVEVSRLLEGLGVKAIALHARTKAQGYRGKADWGIIRQVRSAVSIPVVGNGDVTSSDAACRMREKTGCEAVMIGRAAMRSPGVFSGKTVPFGVLAHEFMVLYGEQERQRFPELQQHLAWFLSGVRAAKGLRQELLNTKTYEELEACVTRISRGI